MIYSYKQGSFFSYCLLTCVFWGISDRPSCQFCPSRSDLHHDRPSVRRVSKSDSDPLDVRPTVHLLQVRPHVALDEPSVVYHIKHWGAGLIGGDEVEFIFFSSVPSNEQPFDPRMKRFTERLLHRPGLGTRCMQGEPLGWVSGLLQLAIKHLEFMQAKNINVEILPVHITVINPREFFNLPPGCPVMTAHQSGSTRTSLPRSSTSYRVPSGTRETRHLPASAAPVRSLPWCPSVPPELEDCPLANDSRPRETRCWIWRTGTSLTTWLKPTPVSSEPGRFRWS